MLLTMMLAGCEGLHAGAKECRGPTAASRVLQALQTADQNLGCRFLALVLYLVMQGGVVMFAYNHKHALLFL